MELQPPAATRLDVLEHKAATLGERVDAHGREIDALTQTVTEIRANDRHRDASLRSIQASLDKHDGKLDAMRQDMIAATTGKSASKWEQAAWLVVATIIGYALLRMGIAG